ncbi:hypothetical protein [Paracoccus aerius]|uniref:Uncharacterized protein n=1 Tax=Paracoccus aerius TaxID=1915382 RepID=A0ABS1SDY4_9RHOB|nr:hypothetical protein [Paracoccus aerius]MBL3675716.1 hypothetical protein [Paracoccus aerius]
MRHWFAAGAFEDKVAAVFAEAVKAALEDLAILIEQAEFQAGTACAEDRDPMGDSSWVQGAV